MPIIDLVRAVCSLLIVGHHLVFYGFLPESARPLAPAFFDWLYEYARMAVQCFLVIGGFTTARRLARLPSMDLGRFGLELWSRYRRTGLPYLAALALAIVGNELARHFMDHPAVSAPPTIVQLVAHATYLQHILGLESLSAGVWYLAIDFQLVALSLVLLWGSQFFCRGAVRSGAERRNRAFIGLGSLVAVGSLFWFNRLSELDVWAVYFFGAYFLGMVAHWTVERRVPSWMPWLWFALIALSLAHDFRPRLLVAAATAGLLLLNATWEGLNGLCNHVLVQGLSKISYSLFLVHFPVCLLADAWGSRFLSHSPKAALAGTLAAFVLSIGAAIAFYRTVEAPCLRAARGAA